MAFKIDTTTVINNDAEVIGKRINYRKGKVYKKFTHVTSSPPNYIFVNYFFNVATGSHFVIDPKADDEYTLSTYGSNLGGIGFSYGDSPFSEEADSDQGTFNFGGFRVATYGTNPRFPGDRTRPGKDRRADAYEMTLLWKNFDKKYSKRFKTANDATNSRIDWNWQNGVSRWTNKGIGLVRGNDAVFKLTTVPNNMDDFYSGSNLIFKCMENCF